MIKKVLFFFSFFSVSFPIFAYVPSDSVLIKTKTLSTKINSYITSQPTEQKNSLLKLLSNKLPLLQSRLFQTHDIDRMYLFEYIRRHLATSEMIDTPDLIDDDSLGVTWTHASKGFSILYSPYSTPLLSGLDEGKRFTTLINGSYFARTEGGNYHAGLLWLDGERQTPFVADDPQLTHIVCLSGGKISLWQNDAYTSEDLVKPCDVALQVGPLIYDMHDGVVQENLEPKTYIGAAHTRTVLVTFTRSDNSQDVWFLTFYKKFTLAEVRDIVLSETRFYGTYKSVQILNLDGGSSVAYLSRPFPKLNFGTQKRLPVVFGIY